MEEYPPLQPEFNKLLGKSNGGENNKSSYGTQQSKIDLHAVVSTPVTTYSNPLETSRQPTSLRMGAEVCSDSDEMGNISESCESVKCVSADDYFLEMSPVVTKIM